MAENQVPMVSGSNPPDNSGAPRVGPPPVPEVNIRTMTSDIKSVERGDATPLPESVLPKEIQNEPVFSPETMTPENNPAKATNKNWLIWTGVTILILVGGGIAYFSVFRSKNPPASPAPTPVTAPKPTTPTHASFFKAPIPKDQIRLNNLLLSSVTTALQSYAATLTGTSTLKEIEIVDKDGAPASWKNYFKVFGVDLNDEKLSAFEGDFTAFVFKDSNGSWPGYIAMLKSSSTSATILTDLKAIESADITKFYLAPTGSFGNFKDGKVKTFTTRYATGSKPGVAFNYGLIDNKYLVISTSYKGLQESVNALGL